ncbi:MAG: hypothetical protein NTV80_03470 [Verrucomicrobia bacterium]|nr:hypothetical protein [Verrucomicrobiota bacterium]
MKKAASGVYDPLADDEKSQAKGAAKPAKAGAAVEGKKKFLHFYKPSELAAYETPEDVPLIGDLHIYRGGIFVLGGAPGVGKCTEYKHHCEVPGLDEWVRVSGDVDTFAFESPDFCEEFRVEVAAFAPDVIVLDPWNRAARDCMEKDFRQAFENIIACLPEGSARPALVIVAHTRKPRMGERVNGRGLLNLLSGSLILGSVPRAAFILQAASDDTERKEFVFCCCKNNNGELGKATAWKREGVRFLGPLTDFDWDSFNNGSTGAAGKNQKIEESDLIEVFDGGRKWLSKDKAAKALMQVAGAGRSAAYSALDMVKGRFNHLLRVNPANGQFSVHEEPEGWDGDGEA